MFFLPLLCPSLLAFPWGQLIGFQSGFMAPRAFSHYVVHFPPHSGKQKGGRLPIPPLSLFLLVLFCTVFLFFFFPSSFLSSPSHLAVVCPVLCSSVFGCVRVCVCASSTLFIHHSFVVLECGGRRQRGTPIHVGSGKSLLRENKRKGSRSQYSTGTKQTHTKKHTERERPETIF